MMTPLELAEKYITNTQVSLFLTGKAGTGKTTFLRHIVQTVKKRSVVLAPTGVAAVNAHGVTIHSFFQLPLCPYLPDVKELVTEYQMPEKKRSLRKEKIELIRTLDLIIIDEISMVRADLLDAIDDSLRRYRRSAKPFGGVQLLMIGDVHQLPPVVTDKEKPFMDRVYPSPFFFHSKALKRLNYITIELTHIFRQQDARFISILNNIRDNRFDDATLAALNERYMPGFDPADEEGYIRLTTHNYQADSVNRRKLEALSSRPFELKAAVEGNFPESSFPTDGVLVLKKGAQVMFVKNDASGGAYFNGKLATVEGFDNEEGVAVVDHEGNHIVVKRERWENLRYEVDANDGQIKQQIDGTFVQFPLKLAWAITVHKSQGLTFDKVIIDAQNAFTFGQVYVALSRCRTLEGVVLESRISAHNAFDNADVVEFNNSFPSIDSVQQQLEASVSEYFYAMVNELFDMSEVARSADRLRRIFVDHLRTIYPQQSQKMADLYNNQVVNLMSVAEKFHRQLVNIRQQSGDDIHNALLMERITKGVDYFESQLNAIFLIAATLIEVEVDNKTVAKDLDEWAGNFRDAVGLKQRCLARVKQHGFSTQTYNQAKVDFMLDKERTAESSKSRKRAKTAASVDVPNPGLVDSLKRWRMELSRERNVPAYVVLSQKALLGIAAIMPQTMAELLTVSGVGKTTCRLYGDAILEVVQEYMHRQGIKKSQQQMAMAQESASEYADRQPEPSKKEPAWVGSVKLMAEGLTLEQVATQRGLKPSTVASHLQQALEAGVVDIDVILSPSELDEIVEYIIEDHPQSLTEMYRHFEERYPYYKLRAALFVSRDIIDS